MQLSDRDIQAVRVMMGQTSPIADRQTRRTKRRFFKGVLMSWHQFGKARQQELIKLSNAKAPLDELEELMAAAHEAEENTDHPMQKARLGGQAGLLKRILHRMGTAQQTLRSKLNL